MSLVYLSIENQYKTIQEVTPIQTLCAIFMELSNAIKERRLVDINLFDGKLTYTGICLAATKRLVVLANYNSRKKTFDGFSIFKNESFDSYEIWKKKAVQIDIDNSVELANKYKVNNYKTFYSWFKKLSNDKLIAFFFDNDFKSYYVGKILRTDTKKVTVKLVDTDGTWTTTKSFKILDIDFFSFDTLYEYGLSQTAHNMNCVKKQINSALFYGFAEQ